MKTFVLVLSILVISIQEINSQWNVEYTSIPIDSTVYSGWMNFKKEGDNWDNRFYYLNATSFNVMSADYSNAVEYSYTFTQPEISAGYYLYSLRVDLTGDGIVEFFVMSVHGMSTSYRWSFKILDITTGNAVFEKNESNFSYSVPFIWDIDNDYILECSVNKLEYPSGTIYYQEVYNTGSSVSSLAPLGMEPPDFHLNQNYPNPFNPSTTIEFNIDKASDVRLRIYDIKGSLVKTVVSGYMNAGHHKVIWDGTNNSGVKAASGMYVYSLNSGDLTDNKKMIILK
jgi:hypothetical protein